MVYARVSHCSGNIFLVEYVRELVNKEFKSDVTFLYYNRICIGSFLFQSYRLEPNGWRNANSHILIIISLNKCKAARKFRIYFFLFIFLNLYFDLSSVCRPVPCYHVVLLSQKVRKLHD